MGLNPFKVSFAKDFFMDDPCENLNVYFQDLKEVNRYGWYFNPWYHRITNWAVAKLAPKTKVKPEYDWNNFDDENYAGPERRSAVRDWVDDFLTSIKRSATMAMMPKTKKTQHLKDAA